MSNSGKKREEKRKGRKYSSSRTDLVAHANQASGSLRTGHSCGQDVGATSRHRLLLVAHHGSGGGQAGEGVHLHAQVTVEGRGGMVTAQR